MYTLLGCSCQHRLTSRAQVGPTRSSTGDGGSAGRIPSCDIIVSIIIIFNYYCVLLCKLTKELRNILL